MHCQNDVFFSNDLMCCKIMPCIDFIFIFFAFTFPPNNLKNNPSIMLLRYHASLLGWYCAGDAPDLMLGIEVYQTRIVFLYLNIPPHVISGAQLE